MEVTVVGVLAAIVMLALTGFYINSQGTWIDASAQAITQREGSLVMEAITDSVHRAASAQLAGGVLTLFDPTPTEICHFWLDSGDSLMHVGNPTQPDQGPLIRSTTTRFDCWANSKMVGITALELRSGNRRTVRFASGAVFYNR
jgi:hypothetical protein